MLLLITLLSRYFVAFTFDTTLGVALAIAFHNLAVRSAKNQADNSYAAACIAECGHYGNLLAPHPIPFATHPES